jgi:endonuclease/exonuclease/phosphatase family metal-dependent hydrolase
MTQNQYLGADLGPIIGATSNEEYAVAIAAALQSIAANNFAERSQALAESIADRQPHLVAMQEVYAFECIDAGYGACALFQGAFNDHLAMTTAALAEYGGDYYVAAELQNLTIPTPFMEFIGLPGLPVFLPGIPGPAMFVSVIDRDVILARGDVATDPVLMDCTRPGRDGIGCHFDHVANVNTLAGPITVERGHVAVDAWVDGAEYRFVNTHLEVHILGGDPTTAALQAAQATELSATLAGNPSPNPASRLILAGDINSAPTHQPIGPIVPPYQQFANGLTFLGAPAFTPLPDTWTLRPGRPDGFTCCEAADLLNGSSGHNVRYDVVFAWPAPVTVKANVMDAETSDKIASGLWPSDHASVIAELSY